MRHLDLVLPVSAGVRNGLPACCDSHPLPPHCDTARLTAIYPPTHPARSLDLDFKGACANTSTVAPGTQPNPAAEAAFADFERKYVETYGSQLTRLVPGECVGHVHVVGLVASAWRRTARSWPAWCRVSAARRAVDGPPAGCEQRRGGQLLWLRAVGLSAC